MKRYAKAPEIDPSDYKKTDVQQTQTIHDYDPEGNIIGVRGLIDLGSVWIDIYGESHFEVIQKISEKIGRMK